MCPKGNRVRLRGLNTSFCLILHNIIIINILNEAGGGWNVAVISGSNIQVDIYYREHKNLYELETIMTVKSFKTLKEAMQVKPDATMIYVPPPHAAKAILDAIDQEGTNITHCRSWR
jgi:succinyl-CoA synthetase alpha subunit